MSDDKTNLVNRTKDNTFEANSSYSNKISADNTFEDSSLSQSKIIDSHKNALESAFLIASISKPDPNLKRVK